MLYINYSETVNDNVYSGQQLVKMNLKFLKCKNSHIYDVLSARYLNGKFFLKYLFLRDSSDSWLNVSDFYYGQSVIKYIIEVVN